MNTDLNKGRFREKDLLKEDYLIIDRRNRDMRIYRHKIPTLRKGNLGLFYVHNKQIYKINGYQSLLLQGFPKEFMEKAKKAKLNPNKILGQAGNAMTVNVVEYVGRALLNSINNTEKNTKCNFIRKKAKNDERYTPAILVKPILEYIPKGSTVWCPFDFENSEFVIALKEQGCKVIWSHIKTGQDFFSYEPKEEYDYIISNPPFSNKLEVLDRLYSIGKPFAILLNLECLNYQEVGTFFLNRNLELLIVDKKVSFDGKTASFNTSYFCNNILPEKLKFVHLEHNNTNKHFIPSRMTSTYN